LLFFDAAVHPLHLLSFPTRRSSDLAHWFDTSAFPPPQQPVMPEVLQQAGYRTGYFGKVHYGPERPGDRACPENHGFDESLYGLRSEEHTSELQSRFDLVCRLLLEKK